MRCAICFEVVTLDQKYRIFGEDVAHSTCVNQTASSQAGGVEVKRAMAASIPQEEEN